jgi:tetratricopeptide (TPR) repeat protein
VALGPFLKKKFGVPVFINNDGDLFAYGEALGGALPEINEKLAAAGSAKRYRNMVGYTFGTGFGVGMIVNGQLNRGDNSCVETFCLPHKKLAGVIVEDGVAVRAVKRVYGELSGNMDHGLEPKDIFDVAEGKREGDAEAARKAFARSAFRDATGYFQFAMDAVDKQSVSIPREQRAIDLRIQARLAFAALGDIERWFELCRDAEARSEKIQDEERRLASMAMRAAALNFYGTPYEAIAVAEKAVTLANQMNNTPWLCLVEYGLGQSYFLSGRYRDAERHLAKATALLTSAPENFPPGTTGSNLLVLCHMMSAIVHAWLGEFDQAERCSEKASILAETNDRPYDMIAADYGRGVVQMMRGDLEEAEIALDQALRVSRESEARLFQPLIMSALGSLYSQQGYGDRATEILLRAKDEADKLGHETSKVAVSAYLGAAYGQLGDIHHGLALLRACQASARQKGYAGIEALAASAEANILAAQGGHMLEEAMACLQRTIEFTARLEALPLLGVAKGVRARLLAASGRTDEAREELVQAITLFDQSKMTVHLQRAKAALSKFSDI